MPQVNEWDAVCKKWAQVLKYDERDGGVTYGIELVIDDLVGTYGLAGVLQAAANVQRHLEQESRLSAASTEAAT
jgi:hypothetical protein